MSGDKLDKTITLCRGSEEWELLVEFEVTYWGDPGRFSGPPEDCYPPEGPELSISRAVMEPPEWAKWKYPRGELIVVLTDAEVNLLEEQIRDTLERPEPDYE